MCPCTPVMIVSTCSAQAMAQLSEASVAASSALAATRPASSTCAEVELRPRGEHEQPGPVPGRDPG